MKLSLWIQVVLLFSAIVSNALAEEINVPTGDGTLAAAITGAADGDTLLLGEGSYSGNVAVNKSLTIRALNRATEAVVTGTMTINGPGIEVTVQGLIFTTSLTVTQGSRVSLLDNVLTSGSMNLNSYSTASGDGSLYVVGNRLYSGNISQIYSENAYIAGNVLFNGYILSFVSVWIVGNDVRDDTGVNPAIRVSSTSGSARILSNRVTKAYSSGSYSCINTTAALSLIAGNLVLVEGGTGNRWGISTGGAGHSLVINNLVRGTDGVEFGSSSAAIDVSNASARIAGNIIIDYQSTAATPIDAAVAEVTHNLCFNSSGTCPAGDGNLNDVDPQFIDLIDYRLAATSPAIDAGPPDQGLADADRTRNDMGAQGGPWSIGQYDVQRDPDSLAPYAYPVFRADSAIFNGNLEVQALGVARLR